MTDPFVPEPQISGVCWVALTQRGRQTFAALERCPKKAAVLGVETWFVPGGKLEPGETPQQALEREFAEEWLGVQLDSAFELPIVQGSSVPPGAKGVFLMRPYLVKIAAGSRPIPAVSGDGVSIAWIATDLALRSPVPQVRMMVAAALWRFERLPRIDIVR